MQFIDFLYFYINLTKKVHRYLKNCVYLHTSFGESQAVTDAKKSICKDSL